VLYFLGTRFNLDGYECEHVLSARSIFHGNGPALARGFSGVPGISDTTGELPVYPRQQYLQSYLSVPFYALGAWIFGEDPAIPGRGGYWDLPWGPMFFVAFVNPLASAGTVLLLLLLAQILGYSERESFHLALLFGLCTMIWPYAGLGMEPVQTFFVTALVTTAIKYRKTNRTLWLILSAVLFILVPNCKKYSIVFLPFIAAYLLMTLWKSPNIIRWKSALLVILGIMGGLAFIVFTLFQRLAIYPDYLFHLWTKIRSPGWPLSDLIFGLTISPGEGLFVFNPILLFAVSGWRSFMRKHRWEGLLFSGLIVSLFVSIIRIRYVLIDEEWGPRYFHAIMPILFIAGAESILKLRRGWAKFCFILTVFVSGFIQLLGVLFMGFSVISAGLSLGTSDLTTQIYTPSLSQLAISSKLFNSMIHRYLTGKSLDMTHTVYKKYLLAGADSETQQISLQGFDQPVGALLTIRWVLGEMGRPVGPEYNMVIAFGVLAGIIILLLWWLARNKRKGVRGSEFEVSD
jgi:hypothetical protein